MTTAFLFFFRCDLWEEFTSDDFYWNRMAFVYSLQTAAEFADAIGENDFEATFFVRI